ncbi:REP-associated tyrosine transposase [Yoonia sp. 2307UL14-13]|uniref:REP-associated tyrosine transposase n=1 Tax=Yoonia sp. 2307UL14-13 TaxID=3126506 RepID=UPI0030B6C581
MANCTRRYVPGGTYFFTVRLQNPQADLLVTHIDLLRDSTRLCRKRWPFTIDAAVILPNKLHMIWTLPPGDADFSKRWRLIKSTFSRHLPTPPDIPENHRKRGEKGIWQRRFWEHVIRDDQDFDRHMHLIAAAPVQAGLVKKSGDWPYSSLRKVALEPPTLKTTVPVPSAPNRTTAATPMRT